ncbi:hypothetical protein GCM10022241_19770 [Micrococcus endophyticus]
MRSRPLERIPTIMATTITASTKGNTTPNTFMVVITGRLLVSGTADGREGRSRGNAPGGAAARARGGPGPTPPLCQVPGAEARPVPVRALTRLVRC